MLIEIIEPPAVEPVTLEEFKKHARVWEDLTDDDDLIRGLITAAREVLERRLARAFILQTIRETRPIRDGRYRVLRAPVRESVSLVVDGEPVELSGGLSTCGGMLVGDTCVTGDVSVYTYKAGYGPAPADVPQTLRLAILMLATHFYDTRSASEDLPPLVATLASAFSWGGEMPPL